MINVKQLCLLSLSIGSCVLLLSCKCPPVKVMKEMVSPNKTNRAELTEDRCTRSNGSAIYRVNLDAEDTSHAPVTLLETNLGWKIDIKWTGPENLTVSCQECGISVGDVHFFRRSAFGINIDYVGIPTDETKPKK
jgi:hypothetical protein